MGKGGLFGEEYLLVMFAKKRFTKIENQPILGTNKVLKTLFGIDTRK